MPLEGNFFQPAGDEQKSENLQLPHDEGATWSQEDAFAAGMSAAKDKLEFEGGSGDAGAKNIETFGGDTVATDINLEWKRFNDDMRTLEESGVEVPPEVEERINAFVRELMQKNRNNRVEP